MELTRVLLLLAPLTCATITANDNNEPVNDEPVATGPDSLKQLFRRVFNDVSI